MKTVDPFDGGGELETARELCEGNPRAEMLCELAAVLAACAVDVATAADDSEASKGVARALDVLEHLRDTLTRDPNA